MNSSAIIIGQVALIWAIAAVTPGPNLLVTVRTRLSAGQPQAVRTVLGIACATGLWGIFGFLGVAALLAASPALYQALKVLGGFYLFYLGLRVLWGELFVKTRNTEQVDVRPFESRVSAWSAGFLTNLANPKTAVFVTSLFAATMPPAPPLWLGLTAVAVMVFVSLSWYMTVACMIGVWSTSKIAKGLRRQVSCLAGGLFVFFGAKLILLTE